MQRRPTSPKPDAPSIPPPAEWSECRLAGKLYGRPFGVDVAFGDPLVGDPDEVISDDILAFAGIEPPRLRLYPVVSHIAEKLHAYTMPRNRTNSRMKDLPDIALLASAGAIDAATLRMALEKTFEFRATHTLPDDVPQPPTSWQAPFRRATASAERNNQSRCRDHLRLVGQQRGNR